ncbi:MAG: molybdate ABC transporter substrate-binding protein [Opitutaceae bacterium]|nr:molybdate ABC transporter substrate-binding protein [Opitutaceae bacterium]
MQTPAAAATLSVAAAANLVYALDALHAAFKQLEPETTINVTLGASGSLVTQITHGAPFDVFLSADLYYPQALIKAGQADADSLTPFATGQLVLWTTKPGLELTALATAVRQPSVKKIAIANPATAPYGRAAQAALTQLGVWAEVQPRLVTGENISQTAQFVSSGNADLGFVALSLVLSPQLAEKGRWLAVPAGLHAPLTQGAVLTRRGAANPAARRYLEFLLSPTARGVFARFGYGPPVPVLPAMHP